MAHPDTPESPLGQALALWAMGKAIPLDLYAKLREAGYDVSALERRHRR